MCVSVQFGFIFQLSIDYFFLLETDALHIIIIMGENSSSFQNVWRPKQFGHFQSLFHGKFKYKCFHCSHTSAQYEVFI